MKKKLLAGILSLAMVFSMMPVTPVSAEEADNATQTETQTENEQEQEKEPETEAVPEETEEQTSDSEAIKALQSRINALPTVDEFIALADGTTVEDSTLNQAQLDVYNEAQAIAEEMDKLTDEEQGQLDTGKLEALFEYFNGMTEETALTPGSTTTLTSSRQYITQAGTYNINTSTVSSSTANSALTIQNTSASDNIVINIKGNITIKGSKAIIYITSPCNLTINGNGYTIKNSGSGNVLYSEAAANISVNGGTYYATSAPSIALDSGTNANLNGITVTSGQINNSSGCTTTMTNCNVSGSNLPIANSGTMYVKSGSYSRTGSSGQVFSNGTGTLYIQGGTITNVSGTNDAVATGTGKVYMTGGTVSAPNGGAIRFSDGGTAEITGGTISGSKYGVYLKAGSPACTIGNVTFSGNTNDVYLESGLKFTLSTDYKGTNNIKVGIADTVSGSTKRQITTAGTAESMLEKVTSVAGYSVNYSTSGKYLYFWVHTHKLTCSSNGNTITAKCTSDSDCKYYSDGLTLTLTAPDMTYTGSAYNKASKTDNITSVLGGTVGSIKYAGRAGTSYTESTTPPTNAGDYTAKVTYTNGSSSATATADFTINKAEVTKPSADSSTFVYDGSSQTYNVAASDKYTVTGNTRTDAGKQTVTVALNDKTNCKWSDGSTDDLTFAFTIAKADLNLSLALKNWVYGTTPSTLELDGYKGDGTISYFYKKQGEANTEYKPITEADFKKIPVGKYTLKASVATGTNYNSAEATCDFAVTKQPITVSVSMDGWTYGEEAKTPSVTVKAEENDITSSYKKSQITYTYYTDSECKNKVVPKNAGTYYVKAEVEATDNYSDGSAVAEFTIAKKAVTATVTADNKTYDGTTNATVSAVVADSDLVLGDSITITGLTGTFEDQNAGTEKKVTVDSLNAEYAGTGVENYDITIASSEAKASIEKCTAALTWSKTDLTYTGNEQSVTAEVSNAISGDKFTLTYEGNTQTKVGSYTAKVTALGNDNYKLPSAKDAKTAWKISYLTAGTVTVSGTKGENDWYVSKVTVTPEDGYEISTDGKEWQTSLAYDAQGSNTVTYYLKESATGAVSDQKTEVLNIDSELPTGEIKIKDNGFTEFLNTITFKYFFKKTVDVKITGADATSGIAKIEYQKVADGQAFDPNGTWTAGKSFSMKANEKSAIYARITDNAGNSKIINSDGIVVYTDATATAEETFTKTSADDITTGIAVNGNTIASIKNGDKLLLESEYEIKEGKLVLKASYLKTLAAGTYTIAVSYHPYGEAYTEDSTGEAPDTSVITLTVKKAEGSISDVSDISKVYDGTPVTAPTFTTTNDRGTDDANVTIEYKKQGADDSTYTSEAPKDSGAYVVRITVKADESYGRVTVTKEFSIQTKEMNVSAEGYTGTYDGKAHGITVHVTEPADSEAVKVTYGSKNADGKITYGKNSVDYKDAGEYTVYYKVTADNYEDAEGSAVVKIEQKTVSLVWGNTEFTYDGSTHVPTAKVKDSDLVGSDQAEVTVEGAQTTAGEYTATASALSNGNYVLGTDVTTTFCIKATAVTVTVDDATKHIGKEDPKFTYKVTGLVSGESLKDITVTREKGETAGRYAITAKAKDGSNANYEITFVDGTFTITDHVKAETPVEENRVEPTCTKDGSYEEVYNCTVDGCGAELERVKKTIPAIGHSYGEPKFTWSKDYSTATAEFTCANDKTHVENVSCKVTSETTNATCENAGKTVYTAAAEFEGKNYTDSKETVIPATGHSYGEPEFTWNKDHSKATATFICKNDANHIESVSCDVTSKKTEPTCTEDGKVVYTATCSFKGNVGEEAKTYTDTAEEAVKATGHSYGEPKFTWSKDYGTATAEFTCANDKTHVENVSCKVTSETTKATCENAGKTVYTAAAEFEGKNYTDSKETVIPATGHSYGEPKFTWNKDHSKATATFTCANAESHVKTVDCKVTQEVTKQATGTEKGEVTYTAEAALDGKTYRDTKTEETEMAGSEEIGSNGGKITTEIIVADDMPKTEIKNLTVGTAKSLLTTEELAQVESGAEITIYLEAKSLAQEEVSTGDKNHVESQLDSIADKLIQSEKLTSRKEVATGIQYIDLSLYKKIGNGTATKLKSTGENELEITVDIPENLKSDNSRRTYYIIRVHETDAGTEVAILPATKSGDTLTFKTDRFSTYAIAYAEPNGVIVPTKVTLDKKQETLTAKGSTTQLTATVEPGNATNKNVTWKSSDTNVATVDANGLVTAVGNGTATITVTTEEGSLTAEVTIIVNIPSGGNSGGTPVIPTTPEVQKPVSVSLNKTKETLTAKGSTTALTATVKPDNAANKNVTWKSSDTNVATVDANGLVTAVGNGTAVITVTTVEGGRTAAATIMVKIPSGDNKNNVTDQSKYTGNQVSKLKLPILLAKGKGGKKQITLNWLNVKDADGYEAYWSYCDGGKNYKKFAAVKNGKLTVTQKKLKNSEMYKYFVAAYKMVDGKKVYIARSNYLHVAMMDSKQTNAKSVSVNQTDVMLKKKQTFTIQTQIRLENGKKKPLLHAAEYRYYTTDASVAKINSDGVITAKGAGSCTIYVLANNGVYKKIKVTVK